MKQTTLLLRATKLLLGFTLFLLLALPAHNASADVTCAHNANVPRVTSFAKARQKKLKAYVYVNGKLFFLDAHSKPMTGNGKHRIQWGKIFMLLNGDGSTSNLVYNGWQQDAAGNLYLTCTCGRIWHGCTKRGIRLAWNGVAISNDEVNFLKVALRYANTVSDVNASQSTRLRQCWNYIVSRNFHYSSKYPVISTAGFRSLAINMLETHYGNCYGFACAFAALAKAIGYNPLVINGLVHGSRDHRADGYTRHSWVQIGGANYDPEGQFAGWRTGCYGWGSYRGIINGRYYI